MKVVKRLIKLLLLVIIGLIGYMNRLANAKNILLHSFSIGEEQQTDQKISIFFISDIHRRKLDASFIRRVKSYGNIDVVMVGGDLAEKGVPLQRVEKNIEQLSSIAPLYFVWGNNDREIGEQAMRTMIARHGGIVIENNAVPIPEHPDWGIVGTDDPSSGNVQIEKAFEQASHFRYLIFLAHTPSLFKKIPSNVQPILKLAGHTHGGQIRIGSFGMHEKGAFSIDNGVAKLVSNGYGTTLIPCRLGAPPQSHVIQIRYAFN